MGGSPADPKVEILPATENVKTEKIPEKESDSEPQPTPDPLKVYTDWTKFTSAPRSDPDAFFQDELRKLYPDHEMAVVQTWNLGVLWTLPDTAIVPLDGVPSNTTTSFVPLPRRSGASGLIAESLDFGAHKVIWKTFEFLVFTFSFDVPYGRDQKQAILFDGSRAVLLAFLGVVGTYKNELREEILVFSDGYWQHDHELWVDIQKADWKEIILKEEFKNAFQKDIESFFESEELYKSYAIPWKRGIIMHGPPGNGKTISLKAVMKYSKNPCLYVRSFQTWGGIELGMTMVFGKAREMAPCILVLEDLDTLIDETNRSFFLNQLDGLKGNDGLLLLSTTNHLDRLDPSLSKRPSRFDRKFLFDDPDRDERRLYAQYWQNKLRNNTAVDFPDSLLDKIADATDKFSFAYLKEAFVSSLVQMADSENKSSFAELLLVQIKILKKGLEDQPGDEPPQSSHEEWQLA